MRLRWVWVYVWPAADKSEFRRVEGARDYLVRFPLPWLVRSR